MSFDISSHTCNLGTRTAQRKNPLTGKVQSVPVDDGLFDAERADPDEFGQLLGVAAWQADRDQVAGE